MEPKRALAPLSHIDNQIQEKNDPITFCPSVLNPPICQP